MKTTNLILHPLDNIAIVIDDTGPVPAGHKIATQFIAKDSAVLKFGSPIGRAKTDIQLNEHVHSHNIYYDSTLSHNNVYKPTSNQSENLNQAVLPEAFQGYIRGRGPAGIRNYLVVVATVNCSATVVKRICQKFTKNDLLKYNIDGVIPVTHQAGCAQAIGGLNYSVLNRTLAGWIYHPNVVGAVVVGLGCEGTTWKSIEASAKVDNRYDENLPIDFLKIQDVGGTALAINQGIESVQKILDNLPPLNRQSVSVGDLNLALNCGGSDAFSSLTANPLLGMVSDLIVKLNGSVALAEIPECHGAENLLFSRSKTDAIRLKLTNIFSWWESYSEKNNVNLNNNLSPGNISGGISTIVEKSLGAVVKAGQSPLCGVFDYSESMLNNRGFLLMNTPGFDPVSVTGLAAGGSQMVAFTTGRGSVFGCGISPTVKISTNTNLFLKMKDDMDFDAGRILSQGISMEQLSYELYNFIIDVASGKPTKSEILDMGSEEFTPWPIGETL